LAALRCAETNWCRSRTRAHCYVLFLRPTVSQLPEPVCSPRLMRCERTATRIVDTALPNEKIIDFIWQRMGWMNLATLVRGARLAQRGHDVGMTVLSCIIQRGHVVVMDRINIGSFRKE
jgi:hypothetical protein